MGGDKQQKQANEPGFRARLKQKSKTTYKGAVPTTMLPDKIVNGREFRQVNEDSKVLAPLADMDLFEKIEAPLISIPGYLQVREMLVMFSFPIERRPDEQVIQSFGLLERKINVYSLDIEPEKEDVVHIQFALKNVSSLNARFPVKSATRYKTNKGGSIKHYPKWHQKTIMTNQLDYFTFTVKYLMNNYQVWIKLRSCPDVGCKKMDGRGDLNTMCFKQFRMLYRYQTMPPLLN